MMTKARTAVIGLGRIGSGYDHHQTSGLPRSHVGAILGNSDFDLVAVCDSDPVARLRFEHERPTPARMYASVAQLLDAGSYDVIVIAVPATLHAETLEACLDVRPGIIFCEKPMCDSLPAATELAAKYAVAGIPLMVNYHRRWDSRIANLRSAIMGAGWIGAAQLHYVKGLRNYGAHGVDLLQNFFGAVSHVDADPTTLRFEDDPSMSAQLHFSQGLTASLIGLDGLDYELFDLDVVAQRARFRLEFGGQSIRRQVPAAGRFFPHYVSLSEEQLLVPDAPVHGLTEAYREIAAWVLNGRPPSVSMAANAVAVHRVLAAIKMSAIEGRRIVV
jgi:predicted dehydrogenase